MPSTGLVGGLHRLGGLVGGLRVPGARRVGHAVLRAIRAAQRHDRATYGSKSARRSDR
ncbi:hypothetical protein BKA18_003286 [Streptomyces auratus]